MNTQKPDRRITRAVILLVAALAPPAILTRFSVGSVHKSPIPAIAILAIYEVLIAIFAFAGPIYTELKKRWTARLVDIIDAWLQRILSRYTRAYLRYVRAANGYVDLKGLTTRGEYTLSLDEVFVSLKLESNAPHSLSSDPISYSTKDRTDSQSIWFWLGRAKFEGMPLAIIGPPGSGKTTLLKHVAFVLARNGQTSSKHGKLRKVPIIIPLRDHKDQFTYGTPDLVDLIRASLSELARVEPTGWVESQLRRNRFLIMLDGLDEIADATVRRSMADWTDQQLSAYPGVSIVVTSRPFGYRDNPLAAATVIQVQPFREDQVENFLERWYTATCIRSFGSDNDASRLAARSGFKDLIHKLEANSYLLELATNPLLLTMIANVHHYRGALPGSRSELYKEVCEVFLGKRHQARGVVVDMPAGQKQAVLQTLAFEMMKMQVRDVSSEDASHIISTALANVAPSTSPSDFLRRVEESSGLLLERERGSYSFAHLTFQEYLASTYARDHGLITTLVDNAARSWWRETIRLYSAQADATPIIERCLRESDSNPGALALAVECAEEGREVNPKIRAQLAVLVSPPDARSNPSARRTAGLIRLMLRSGNFRRVSRDVFISPRLVSCIEYQAFLDEERHDPSRVPDHWNDNVYPEGAEEAPITGIRFSDALAFCDWVNDQFFQLSNNWHYRLPSTGELSTDGGHQLLATLLCDQAKLVWSTKMAIQLEEPSPEGVATHLDDNVREVRITFSSPVTINPRFKAKVVYEPDGSRLGYSQPPVEFLYEQLASDANAATEASDVSAKSGRSIVAHNSERIDNSELELRYIACYVNSAKPLRRLEQAWNKIRFLDLDAIVSQVESVQGRLLPFVDPGSISSLDPVRQRLGSLAQELSSLTAVALNRSAAKPYMRFTELREQRLFARLCALACSAICAQLNDDIDAVGSRDWKHNVDRVLSRIRRFRYVRAGNYSKQVRQLLNAREASQFRSANTLNDFAEEFAYIYANLVVLEGRFNGVLPAWEALTFVRTSRPVPTAAFYTVEKALQVGDAISIDGTPAKINLEEAE